MDILTENWRCATIRELLHINIIKPELIEQNELNDNRNHWCTFTTQLKSLNHFTDNVLVHRITENIDERLGATMDEAVKAQIDEL